MKIGSAVVSTGRMDDAIERVLSLALDPLAPDRPDLALLFVTNHFEDELPRAAARVRSRAGVEALLGCTAEGVIGAQGEIEREPAVSLWLAHLPGVAVETVHLDPADAEEPDDAPLIRRLRSLPAERNPAVVLLADPYSFQVVAFLSALNEVCPHVPIIGGMTSGADAPTQSVLVQDDQTFREGAVGVLLHGDIRVDTIVSHGCRPVGRPFVITAAEQNIVKQLGGKPALAMLQEVFSAAGAEERRLLEQGVFVGQVINEYKESFERGDFLVRNLIGADQRSGALAIADYARVGRTIQFHVRDARTADEDLRMLLAVHASPPPAGALLFSCNGRGSRMFAEPNHDLAGIQSVVGNVPVGGFFAAGELGPVGGRNFIHGHTASIALLRPAAGH